ncbi:MAG: hypothetical protein IT384_03725 [Deltaproteobacteria bacterium]|nr:hypothetical protein [Deltaproteobacteria bacterium]
MSRPMRRALLGLWVLLAGCADGLGVPCTRLGECQTSTLAYCAATGICVESCRAPGEPCAHGAGTCTSTFSSVVCLRKCQSDRDCRPGEACQAQGPNRRACVIVDVTARP